MKKIFILLSVLIYLISISPTKDLLLYPLLVKFEDSNCDDFDAIVILGGGVYAGGELKEDSLKRLVEGYIIAKEFDKPIILSGGRVSKKIEPEAMVMRKKLIKLGFDGRIFLDDKSKDTFENAKFVKRIITDNGYKKVLLITSGYHLLRSKILFDKLGVNSCAKLVDKKIDKNIIL
ncbi:YdcF family protein [Deferribacter thermophilus]|uniref:YdcF family protein n=1 Tax=Deferribacter thermophilus TaxID=53573 RepID=UPI003C2576F1